MPDEVCSMSGIRTTAVGENMANNEYGTTWWGRRWLDALSGIDFENRIPRGKDYADGGKVRSLRIDEAKGEIKARVTGHYGIVRK